MLVSASVYEPTSAGPQGIACDNLSAQTGILIINADDWGRDQVTTQRILECVDNGAVFAASAMVYMGDSERAAGTARERALDVGLHLNLTTPFTRRGTPTALAERQRETCAYLVRHPLARIFYNPVLRRTFEYVVAAQLDEFRRLYGQNPQRIDGHHHMHLCRNVLSGKLLPSGTIVRRNFSFQPGEKSYANRLYRGLVDRQLARRHRLTDLFFSLAPLDPPGRLQKIFLLARENAVEVETHPVNPEEYKFLTSDKLLRLAANVRVGPFSQWTTKART